MATVQEFLGDIDMVGNAINNVATATQPGQAVNYSQIIKKYAQNIGDGTSSSISVTHNLGTDDVVVQVRKTASPYNLMVPSDIQVTDTNTVTFVFAVAPTVNQYRVVILG